MIEVVVPSGILSGLAISDARLGLGFTVHELSCHVSRSWTSEPSNLEQALAPMHVQASQNCPHRHDTWMLVSMHLALGVARRRHPTAYAVHCSARHKTSVHRDLFQHIHLQDLPKLARANARSCHGQFLLELELVSVTGDSSDQKHTASWIMHDLLHQTFHLAVALYT